MSHPLPFVARLNSLSQNYRDWCAILDAHAEDIPLVEPAPIPVPGRVGDTAMYVHGIDWRLLTVEELDRLIDLVTRALRTDDRSQGMKYLQIRGSYPIPVDDIIITMIPQRLGEE